MINISFKVGNVQKAIFQAGHPDARNPDLKRYIAFVQKHVHAFYQLLATGIIIIAAVLIDSATRKNG